MMSSLNLYFSAITASMTASLFGYSVGFIGGIIVLPSFLTHYQLSTLPPSQLASAQARIVSLWLLGALFGVLLGMPITSRLGRKPALFLSATLYVVGSALQLVDLGGLATFELGRGVNGLGVGCGTLVSPMFISEISTRESRAMLMSGYQTILQISALAGFWIAFASNSIYPDTSTSQFRLPIVIQLFPGSLLLIGTFFIPETPRFLAEKGRLEHAEKALAWLRGIPEEEEWRVRNEMVDIEDAARVAKVMKEKTAKRGFWQEALKPGVRNRLVVGVGLMIAQNMVGLNALNYCMFLFWSLPYSPMPEFTLGFKLTMFAHKG
jgi:MFS family permease